MEAEKLGNEVGGEHADEGVVVLHRFVELPARIGDAVFTTFELRLELHVVLVGL